MISVMVGNADKTKLESCKWFKGSYRDDKNNPQMTQNTLINGSLICTVLHNCILITKLFSKYYKRNVNVLSMYNYIMHKENK